MIKHNVSIASLMPCQHLQSITQNVGQSLVDNGGRTGLWLWWEGGRLIKHNTSINTSALVIG